MNRSVPRSFKVRASLARAGARCKRCVEWTVRQLGQANPPDLLIVGAQKAGTTSLFHYLNDFPGFAGAQRKEVRFFSNVSNYSRGNSWYEKFFMGRFSDVHFEATPEYLYDPEVPPRIQSQYPNVRIVIVLREPVERAYSAWNMYRRWANAGFMPLVLWQNRHRSPLFSLFFEGTPPSFAEYIEHEMQLLGTKEPPLEPSILRRGLYAEQVARFLNAFASEHVLVLGFRELVEYPMDVAALVAAFATGQDSPTASASVPGSDDAFNKGNYLEQCPVEVAERLRAFYLPHNERLAELLGGRLPPW